MLRGAVGPQLVERLAAELTAWLAAPADPPPPLNRHAQLPNKQHVANPHYGSAVFQQLNLCPEILRVVSGLLLGAPRLMAAVATRMELDPAAAVDPLASTAMTTHSSSRPD